MAVMQHDRQEVPAYLEHQQASAEEQRQAWNWVRQGENSLTIHGSSMTDLANRWTSSPL